MPWIYQRIIIPTMSQINLAIWLAPLVEMVFKF